MGMDVTAIITQFGYFGLFIVNVLAASVLPLSSEIIVVAMPSFGYNIWLVGLVATFGNYVGALTMYYMGLKGTEFVFARYMSIEPQKWTRAEQWFKRWGPAALLLCWVPIVGDPLCAVAGGLQMEIWRFSIWAFVGKGWRYVILLGLWEYFF